MNTHPAAGLPAFDKCEMQVLCIQEYRRFIHEHLVERIMHKKNFVQNEGIERPLTRISCAVHTRYELFFIAYNIIYLRYQKS